MPYSITRAYAIDYLDASFSLELEVWQMHHSNVIRTYPQSTGVIVSMYDINCIYKNMYLWTIAICFGFLSHYWQNRGQSGTRLSHLNARNMEPTLLCLYRGIFTNIQINKKRIFSYALWLNILAMLEKHKLNLL